MFKYEVFCLHREPSPEVKDAGIPVQDLPRCKKENCTGLLRPHVVWFGEGLDPAVLESADQELKECDLCLVVGTSSVVYPAAMFAPEVASRGVPVAEINMEETDVTAGLGFHFQGAAGSIVPEVLAKHEGVAVNPSSAFIRYKKLEK
ncbi:NAD-dependent protein deacylase sirtuin-5, mitochondrial [Mizuhopecten yessoensis]|uniref:NAD-dependent protein deacylase sirtuin-5, mitochondrial n=1 Tax=Mizuhopecten yessoensis TaxID=6573 RepID=A0A210PLP7_MIZYE|nr:NAD-dependent protein deacylase sirtuin-5, mitochondrial [Mizuhopecten yessoensis]